MGLSGAARAAVKPSRFCARAAESGDPYPLAILDMQMPEMDGIDSLRVIKSDPRISRTKLVVLTSMCERINPAELQARVSTPGWLNR